MILSNARRFAAFLLMTGLAGQSTDAPAKKDPRAFFALNCAVCHGADGSARGAGGSRLKGQDFTDAKEMKGFTDPELAKTIRKGKPFGRMPAFKDQLSEAEALEMVRQVLRKAEKGKVIAPEAPAK